MDINTLRDSYKSWMQTTADLKERRLAWIDATLDFGFKLHLARREHKDNREFSIWLDHAGFKEITSDDRAAFILIGEYPAIAREIMSETDLTSIRLIGAAVKRSVRRAAKTVSQKPKKQKIKKIETKVFARRLLAALRRKRKEAHDVDITRKWRPEAISVMDLHEILGWLEKSLEEFVKTGGSSLEDADASGGQDVSDYKNGTAAVDIGNRSTVFVDGENNGGAPA